MTVLNVLLFLFLFPTARCELVRPPLNTTRLAIAVTVWEIATICETKKYAHTYGYERDTAFTLAHHTIWSTLNKLDKLNRTGRHTSRLSADIRVYLLPRRRLLRIDFFRFFGKRQRPALLAVCERRPPLRRVSSNSDSPKHEWSGAGHSHSQLHYSTITCCNLG